jgi:hypothetical protein
MHAGEPMEIRRTRRPGRVMLIAIVTLAIVVRVAVGVYVGAFVIASPMFG